MSNSLKALADLKLLVRQTETELGISDYSHLNRSLLMAVTDLHENNGRAATSDLIDHPLLERILKTVNFSRIESSGNVWRYQKSRTCTRFLCTSLIARYQFAWPHIHVCWVCKCRTKSKILL